MIETTMAKIKERRIQTCSSTLWKQKYGKQSVL